MPFYTRHMTQRIAVVADVHGNLTAYQAVLADIHRRGIARIINLGDVVGKGPRGRACVELTREHCEATVRGNWEAYVRSPEPDNVAMQWWHDEAGSEALDWLGQLPGSLDLDVAGRVVRFFHASPVDEFTRIHRNPSEETFASMFAPTPFTGVDGPVADIVIYGDIHQAYQLTDEGRILANTGSAGNPLDGPIPSYLIIEAGEGPEDPFSLHHVRVPYDATTEIAFAQQVEMPQYRAWQIELETGVYRGDHAARGLS